MDALPKLTIAEMGESIALTRQVDMWAHGGDMRAFGGEPSPPATSLERGAIMAFDVAITGEDGFGKPNGVSKSDRNNLVDLMSNALRIAVVSERERDKTTERSDVDNARLVLVSMGMIQAMRDRADGLEPDPLENRVLESARRKSGLEASSFDRSDAHGVAVGMIDMVKGEEAIRQVSSALDGIGRPMADDLVEDKLRQADATWPKVEPRAPVAASSMAKGSLDSSVPQAHLQRQAMDKAHFGR